MFTRLAFRSRLIGVPDASRTGAADPGSDAAAETHPRFRAAHRARLSSALVVAARMVAIVSVLDALTHAILRPATGLAVVALDCFLVTVCAIVVATQRRWRRAPDLPALAFALTVFNNVMLASVLAHERFALDLSYAAMTAVTAAILLPWTTRVHAAFLASVAGLTLIYVLGPLGAVIASFQEQNAAVAMAGAMVVSGITHITIGRLRLREFGASIRSRRTNEELRRANATVGAHEARLAEAQAVGQVGSWEWDFITGTPHWSEEARRILGIDAGHAADTDGYIAIVHPEDRPLALQMVPTLHETGAYEQDLRIVRAGGEVRWVQVRVAVVRDAAGRPVRMVGTCLDVTDRRAAEDRIRWLAMHDPLTALPNGASLRDRLEARLAVPGGAFSVAFVDLDDFKLVNDRWGHRVGDAMLRTCADRIAATLAPGDVVARFGGDEFVVLIDDGEPAVVRERLRRVVEAAGQPVVVDGRRLTIRSSAGVVHVTGPASVDDVLRRADVAMYAAKSGGKGRMAEFDSEMEERLHARELMKEELAGAPARGELCLRFQPQFDARARRVVGLEALVRWQHPERGLLTPDQFIPVAEEWGLIVDIDAWVLDEACRTMRALRDSGLVLERMATNLSARTLEDPLLFDRVVAALDRHGVPAACLELEVTESGEIGDFDAVLACLVRLREIGVRIAIDDFGTGYSMLGRLRTLPFDSLKIDKAFVDEISSATSSPPLLVAMVAMAKGLGVRVQAEGIETEEQLLSLIGHGCDEVQGYLLGRPSDEAEIRSLLASQVSAGPAVRKAGATADAGERSPGRGATEGTTRGRVSRTRVRQSSEAAASSARN